MSSFLLVPGAGGSGWYWRQVVAELTSRGHTARAIDLPGDDPDAGLPEYARVIVDAARELEDPDGLVLVGQSLAGFSVPMAAEQLRPTGIVLLNAMIPIPGETAGEWGEHFGSAEARIAAAKQRGYPTDFEPEVYFLHDVPAEVAQEGAEHERMETEKSFTDRCEFSDWAAPVTVLIGRDDRLFPLELQQKIARHRLGQEPHLVPGGHLAAMSQPVAVAAAIVNPPATPG